MQLVTFQDSHGRVTFQGGPFGASPADAAVTALQTFLARIVNAPGTARVQVPSLLPPFDPTANDITLSLADAVAYINAVRAVSNAIKQATGLDETSYRRLLVNTSAAPPGASGELDIAATADDATIIAGQRVDQFTKAIKNLLGLYQSEVVLKSQPIVERPRRGLAIAGGIFFGLTVLGAIYYATRQPKNGAKRRRRR